MDAGQVDRQSANLLDKVAQSPITPLKGPPRTVLIVDFDLFANIGGGQTVYRALIRANPYTQFFYFRKAEPETAPRPFNATPILYRPFYNTNKHKIPTGLNHFYTRYIEAQNLAASVAYSLGPIDFDVVDTPDYSQHGIFLRHAFSHEGIQVGTIALAMHGNISFSIRGNWPIRNDHLRTLAELRLLESLQFRSADARYAISSSYAASVRRVSGLPVNMLDPLCIVGTSIPHSPEYTDDKPDLLFVGRREKLKGPDLFVDMAWWIGKDAYRKITLIGPDGINQDGVGSSEILADMMRRRSLMADSIESVNSDQINSLFMDRSLVILPSRQDTFNLIAIEAIRRGCPLIISRKAGAASWLTYRFPDLPWLVADIDCSRTLAKSARAILTNYHEYRQALVASLLSTPLVADESGYRHIYAPAGDFDLTAREYVRDLAIRFDALSPPRARKPDRYDWGTSPWSPGHRRPRDKKKAKYVRMPHVPAAIRKPSQRLVRNMYLAYADLRTSARRILADARPRSLMIKMELSQRSLQQLKDTRGLPKVLSQLRKGPERSSAELQTKLAFVSARNQQSYVDRIRTLRELIRLQRKRGDNNLIAATYCLRVMRWLGRDAFGDLPFVSQTLSAHEYPAEADAAVAMFEHREQSTSRCLALLDQQRLRHLDKPDLPLLVCDDRRGPGPFRVSVIVSMYRAESKLRVFLQMLAQQTIALRGEMEVILVDSGSPTREYDVFMETTTQPRLPTLYARSSERETIQAAWNRGIRLSTAPYLAFLGVDEGIHPECLDTLAGVLDDEPTVDWAMADSIVTSVDKNGIFDSDVMIYDRRDYRQDLVYLDTCYLSWVGGLYRRSIHDRFGYYDETFRAAGDTEFKCRILPWIRSRHVPKPLGVFNNYPEERSTQHPRAEIEDLRAWYLWRTEAGMQYAFGHRPVDEALRLFRDCLRYRKSFCGHWSTDFDLAWSLARHLSARPEAPSLAATALIEAGRMQDLFRAVEYVRPRRRGVLQQTDLAVHMLTAKLAARRHQRQFDLDFRPHYEIFNDNRYEQHWWSW